MSEPTLITLFVRPLNRLRIPYLVTGGVASVVYGEPRFTRDIDLVIALRASDARRFHELWPAGAFYVPPIEVIEAESRREAHGHFNISHHETALRADVYLAGEDPLNAWAFERAVTRTVDGEDVRLAPIEAVILNKLRYYRQGRSGRHVDDIRRMLAVSGDIVDRAALARWVSRLGLEREWEEVAGEANA